MTSTRPNQHSPFLDALKELRNDEEMTDVVLVCDGGEIKTHWFVLACRSIYFKKMFTSNFMESQTKRVELTTTNVDIMNSILDYLYLESLEKIAIQNLDQILKIHQSSHLFAIADLTNHCWKLIMKSLDVQNIVPIWDTVLLYGEEKEIALTLQFVLKNLQTMIDKDTLIGLKASQYNQLLEELKKGSILITDAILAGILKWREINPCEDCNLEEFLLQMNCDHITKDYMKQLLENERSVFTDKFCRQFIVSHTLSSNAKGDLKTSDSNEKAMIIKQKKSFKLLSISCYLRLLNGYPLNEKASLKIIDIFNEANNITISNLPFLIGDTNFVALVNDCNIYIVNGVHSSLRDKPEVSFLLYDWRKNTTCIKPSIPTAVRNPFYTAIVGDNIYVVEGYVKQPLLLHFSISQEEWKPIPCNLSAYVIGCVNLRESLYFLCLETSNNSHDLYKLINNKIDHVCKVPIPFYDRIVQQSTNSGYTYNVALQKKTVVHSNKLFIFLFCRVNLLRSYAIYNPENLQWKLKTLSYDIEIYDPFECFSIPDDSIYFYFYCTNILYSFHENDDGCGLIKKVMPIRESLSGDGNLTNLKYQKVEKMCAFQSDD